MKKRTRDVPLLLFRELQGQWIYTGLRPLQHAQPMAHQPIDQQEGVQIWPKEETKADVIVKAHHVRSSNFPRPVLATPHWRCCLSSTYGKDFPHRLGWRNYSRRSQRGTGTTAEPLLQPLRSVLLGFPILCRFCPTIRVSSENSPTYIMSTTLRHPQEKNQEAKMALRNQVPVRYVHQQLGVHPCVPFDLRFSFLRALAALFSPSVDHSVSLVDCPPSTTHNTQSSFLTPTLARMHETLLPLSRLNRTKSFNVGSGVPTMQTQTSMQNIVHTQYVK